MILSAISRLVAVDRQLASDALALAQSAGRAQAIARAQQKLAEGDERRGNDDFDQAIQRYK